MNNVYIIDYIRTPISKLSGGLSEVRADDLAAIVLKEIVSRNPDVPVEEIEDVIFGCANQAGEDNRNVARMGLLLAGLPYKIGGETVNRLCASGMSAVANAFRSIASGEGEIYIAGGVEHMTRSPYVMSKPSTAFGRDSQMFDTTFGWRFVNPKMKEMYGVDAMGDTAENLAEMHNISREDQDKFALWSQQKATKAQESGRLAEEIVKVEIPQRKGEPKIFNTDEFIKPTSSMEGLGKLRPAFRKEGTVTAGNASGMNDGAAALILASEEAVKKYGLKPKIHVNQFNSIGGIQAGIKHNALSVDHLEVMTPEDIEALKNTETMPVALPSCSYFLSIPYTPARAMIAAGLPLALATDYNPGSTPSGNMNFVVATACIKMKMTPEEALNAATINGAYAMGISETHGSITIGKKANLIITKPIPSYYQIPYAFGSNLIDTVLIEGEIFS